MAHSADNVRAFIYSLVIHVLCVLLAFSGMFWWQTSKPVQAAGDPIEAVFVDIGDLAPPTPTPRPTPAPRPTPPPPPPPAPPATDLSAQDAIDRERIEREGQLRAEEEAREQEEQRRRAEQILLEQEEQRRQEEEQRRQREREEQQRREREEQQRREREAREQAQREAAEQAEREAAEREAAEQAARRAGSGGQDTGLEAQYASAIQRLVTSHWLRPDTAQRGLVCSVRIVQIPGGDVLSATVVAPCNADEITRRSIEAAVLRAQPLPYAGFESVFQREITFRFRFDG